MKKLGGDFWFGLLSIALLPAIFISFSLCSHKSKADENARFYANENTNRDFVCDALDLDYCDEDNHYWLADSDPLYSIADSSYIGGSFVLATGVIEERMVYGFYTLENGMLAYKTVDAEWCVILEGNYNTPYVERAKLNELGEDSLWGYPDVYIFYLPTGTVLQQMNLDMN